MYTKIPLTSITKISLVQTNGKKTLSQLKTELGCQYIINGTLYNFRNYEINCPCRINGQTVATDIYDYWSYAWNQGPDFKMIHSSTMNNYLNVFSCCAMLKDGQSLRMYYTPAQGGVRGRTAIGIDKWNNLVLFCSKDGSSSALSPEKLQSYMKYNLNCMSAIMLDSGGSSQCNFNGKKIYSSRKVANYICIWTKQAPTPIPNNQCPYSEPTSLIRYGSRGNGAKWVQWHLSKILKINLAIDGIFGRNSLMQLKNFQSKYGLVVDGLCGNNTRAKMKQQL